MKLYLAVAVLILAFVAFTEAQDTDTVEAKSTQFTQQMTDFGQSVVDNIKTAVEKIKTSEAAETAGNWLNAMKKKLEELTQN